MWYAGFCEKVKDNQKNLSTGQIFRISLFLELIKNPEVLILDESLSVLDKELKFKVLKHLRILSKKIIIIIISHDKTLIRKVNRKINLDTYN
jgi:ABC-type bacteriocin/lantibiotic exporter with double-glycine peptidase domain